MAGVALGAALIGGSIFEGQSKKRAQKRSVRRQEKAQRVAESRALAETRRSDQERRRLNRRQPDLGALLADSQRGGATGAGGTLLTGPGGVGRNRLTLGGGGTALGG